MPNATTRCSRLGIPRLVLASTRAEAPSEAGKQPMVLRSSSTAHARLWLDARETWDMVWTPRPGRYVLKVDAFNSFEAPLTLTSDL